MNMIHKASDILLAFNIPTYIYVIGCIILAALVVLTFFILRRMKKREASEKKAETEPVSSDTESANLPRFFCQRAVRTIPMLAMVCFSCFSLSIS